MCFPVVIYVVEVRKSGHLFDGFFVKITIGFYVLLRPHISFFISSIFFEGSSNLKKKHHHNWVSDELLKIKKEQKSHVGSCRIGQVT